MFKKIFKSKPPIKSIVATIEEIHNEFDSASEKLLCEAKAIIAKNKDADKGERLKRLGFRQAAPVAQAKESEEKKKMATLIEYYQIHYPNNKFINEEGVKAICEKYGLVFGDANFYTGDIPEKNIHDIENFKLRDEEKERRTNIDDYYTRIQFNALANLGSGLGRSLERSLPPPPDEIKERLVQPAFKICAPEKDFDMTHYIRKGYKLEYDPIVLQPVTGGYLIVTKWGIEGQDSSLTNEIHN